MGTTMRAALFAAAVLGLAGCAAGEDVFGKPGSGYVEDTAAQVAAADWSKTETITVELSEFEFTPATLTFRQGAPYRLRMENRGDVTHFFASEAFLQTIATQRLRTPQGEIDMPYLRSIAVVPGTRKELFFVPVKKGEYDLECTAPLHSLFGMVGTIQVL